MKQLFLNFAVCFLILHWMNCYEPNKSMIALFVLFLMHLMGLSPPQPNTRRFLVKVRVPFFCPKMTLIFKWLPFNKHWHSETKQHVQIAVLLRFVNMVCLLFSMWQLTMRQFLVKVWVPFFCPTMIAILKWLPLKKVLTSRKKVMHANCSYFNAC